ncbi:GTP pyrophosphokinase [Tepidimicrobium xylanilyticum]|uniref:PpGpp synthetase catalytic domain-containing protein (RelA/SpoT-type nucleotidyltranferase) n=1 Tax=Tepidimicrobium xylanilyticum TaxID=1123352 RepID=A0A1H2RKP7_9FIRM|nr:hypothetical protein [Tepidimicrobium xylanilyticum]GMG95391.1 GTP pyrophosphokinase [Tepidimicrobium xylanilyticum]SDW20053.1 ppGpp synthetase catalytic domain-containing protein (RelA/SpoT-type nucleotidyltranferase) [Tepidimicrobium xylanilyticum]
MRLEIFDFIDDTVTIVDGMRDLLEDGNRELEYFFKEKFLDLDNILNVSSRVKSSMSLKEKIFRNNFYLKYQSPEELVENLTDLIGIRIECRFIEDEEQVYNKLFKIFNKLGEEGYYYNEEKPNILLRLDGKQPRLQKNGFGIYKIEGKYIKEKRTIKFELQIKSLVNVFWGEVEHKVLYKNYKYLITEELFKDIMHSLKENLSMIDRQLMILYNHLKDIDEYNVDKRREQLESILSKIIYEIYSEKTKEEFGFVVDYRKSCDVIVSYVLRKNGLKEAPDKSYDEEFLKVLERLYKIKENEIYIDRLIEFERDIQYEDSFCKKIGEAILEIINKDFKWNLFFKIIFQLGVGNNAEEFEGFLKFLRNRFYKNLENNQTLNSKFTKEEREEIIEYIMDLVADSFIKNREIEFINDDNIECMNRKINITLNKIMNYETWKENIKYFTDELAMKFDNYK